jgi:hypothetical protein
MHRLEDDHDLFIVDEFEIADCSRWQFDGACFKSGNRRANVVDSTTVYYAMKTDLYCQRNILSGF